MLPNNIPLFSLVSGTVNAISGDLSKEVKQKAWEQLLLDHPAVRYVAGTTDAYNADRKGVDKIRIDENTRVALTNYEFDNLSDAFIRDPSDENKAELVKYLANQPEQDQNRLANRFIKTRELFDIPERRWWINTAGMNPEARAAVFYGKYMSLNEKKRQELAEQATMVKGYITDRFTDKLVDLMQSKEQSGGEEE